MRSLMQCGRRPAIDLDDPDLVWPFSHFETGEILDRIPRWGGRVDWSVLCHQILAGFIVRRIEGWRWEDVIGALNHDNHEAGYGFDMADPLKRVAKRDGLEIATWEENLDGAIGKAFDLDASTFRRPLVKEADRFTGAAEAFFFEIAVDYGTYAPDMLDDDVVDLMEMLETSDRNRRIETWAAMAIEAFDAIAARPADACAPASVGVE